MCQLVVKVICKDNNDAIRFSFQFDPTRIMKEACVKSGVKNQTYWGHEAEEQGEGQLRGGDEAKEVLGFWH